METKNDAPKIIIQLSLGALVYYLFTFRYKDILIENLSLQVYYQILVLIVITNSYIAKWIDSLRSYFCHEWMMAFSNRYKAKHYQSKTKSLVEKSKIAQLSEEAKKMIEELSYTDIELENEISDIHKEINKFKEKT